MLNTYTTRLLTQSRSVPSIPSWNSASSANLCFTAENQINNYLSSSYWECKEIRHDPSSQITCHVGVINRKIQGINNFHNSLGSQERFKMFMTNCHRNGTFEYSVLLLKKVRAFYYFRLKRSGKVCGWKHRAMHADMIKTATLTLLSFSPSKFSPCVTFPHIVLHTLLYVLIPHHLIWQPPAPSGYCTLEMWSGWTKMCCGYKRYIGFWRCSMKKEHSWSHSCFYINFMLKW